MSRQDDSGAGAPAGDEPTLATPEWKGDYSGAVFKQRYRIEKELGRGNIGVVYLARDQQLHERPVVIKVLLDTSSENQWFRKKFRQEIEALAKLDHPGIVGAVDLGVTPDGKAFIAMQYVKGKSLRSKIEASGMAFDDVSRIMRQAGQALSAAHAAGVIHCDLKPENIMLQDLGEGEFQTKIVDFGIAKVQDSQVASSSTGTSVAGTPPYMSPEQIEGNPSAATDTFALGVIAYEMLTGRRPFDPRTPHLIRETIRAGVRLKPRILRPELSEAAEAIILKALSYEVADRYERARDFGELLAQALTFDLEIGQEAQAGAEQVLESEIGNPAMPRKLRVKSQRIKLAIGAACLAPLVFAAWWIFGNGNSPASLSSSPSVSVNEQPPKTVNSQTNTSPNKIDPHPPPNRNKTQSLANMNSNSAQNKNRSNLSPPPDPTSWEAIEAFVKSRYTEDIHHVEQLGPPHCPNQCVQRVKGVVMYTNGKTEDRNGIVTYHPGKADFQYQKLP